MDKKILLIGAGEGNISAMVKAKAMEVGMEVICVYPPERTPEETAAHEANDRALEDPVDYTRQEMEMGRQRIPLESGKYKEIEDFLITNPLIFPRDTPDKPGKERRRDRRARERKLVKSIKNKKR